MEGLNFVGAGLIVIGAALGIGRIGGSAMDAIARQPEASGKIQTAMLIAAALMRWFRCIICCLIKIQKNNSYNGWL
jgi:F-type H+-transporting ATPase subunit c